MKKMAVRTAVESETPELLKLIRAKAEFDGCLDSLKADEPSLREALFSNRPKAKALVALFEGEIVGVATYYDIYSSFISKPGIWLDDLYVYESHRRYGIGKALLVKLCEIANKTGCGRIDWIVARDNERGKEFYKNLGATIFEQVRHARFDETAINRILERYA